MKNSTMLAYICLVLIAIPIAASEPQTKEIGRLSRAYKTFKNDMQCLLSRTKKCTPEQRKRIRNNALKLAGVLVAAAGVWAGVSKFRSLREQRGETPGEDNAETHRKSAVSGDVVSDHVKPLLPIAISERTAFPELLKIIVSGNTSPEYTEFVRNSCKRYPSIMSKRAWGDEGWTLLDFAANFGNLAVAEFLVGERANNTAAASISLDRPYDLANKALSRAQKSKDTQKVTDLEKIIEILKSKMAIHPQTVEQPEKTQPEKTQPEKTQPEKTQPEKTQPGETQPGETQPAETQPAETQPAETQPAETQPKKYWALEELIEFSQLSKPSSTEIFQVGELLNSYPDIIRKVDEKKSWTALHYAVFYGSVPLAQLLIAGRADPDLVSGGVSAYGLIKDNVNEDTRKELKKIFEQAVFDSLINIASTKNPSEEQIERAEKSLNAHPDIISKTGWGNLTVLHYAASYGNLAVATLLVDKNADTNAPSRAGTPYKLAEEALLKAKELKDTQKVTDLENIIEIFKSKMVEQPEKTQPEKEQPEKEQPGKKPTETEEEAFKTLYEISILRRPSEEQIERAEKLLRDHPGIISQKYSGMTALHHAANSGNVALVKLLVKKGADITTRSRTGSTPYDLANAALSIEQDEEVIEDLSTIVELLKPKTAIRPRTAVRP